MKFYNSTNLTGAVLEQAKEKAATQNEQILAYFRRYPGVKFGPSQVYEHFNEQWPLTSIRRAITDLTAQGYLIKTNTMQAGLYNCIEHTWQVKIRESLFDE